MNNVDIQPTPNWHDWQGRDWLTVPQGVALWVNLDPDRVCENPERFLGVCGKAIMKYTKLLQEVERNYWISTVTEKGNEKIPRNVFFDWLRTHHYAALSDEARRYIQLTPYVDEIIEDKSIRGVPNKQAAIAWALFNASGEFSIIDDRVQVTVYEFLRRLRLYIPPHHLKGFFDGGDEQIKRNLKDARDSPMKFIHGNRKHK